MKNRFLALLICAILVFSIIPFGKNIKASQTNNNAKQVNTPEQMAAVTREKANNNTARMKGKITQSQVNETIKQKLIVKTRDEIVIETLAQQGKSTTKQMHGKTVAKSFKELLKEVDTLAPDVKKITKKRLRVLNAAQLAGYLFSGLVLGLGIPNLNIYVTNALDKKRKSATHVAQ